MYIDGLTLTGESQIERAILDPNKRGTEFPSNPVHSQVFHLSEAADGKEPGVYVYSEVRGDWVTQEVVEEYPYDVSMLAFGRPRADDTIAKLIVVRSFIIAANFENSLAVADTAATNEMVFPVYVSDVNKTSTTQLGVLTFAAGSKIGVFTPNDADKDLVVLRGEMLWVETPSAADPTLSDISITVAGKLVLAGQ